MSDGDRYLPPDPLPGLDDVVVGEGRVIDEMSIVIPTLGRPILEKGLASILGGDAWPAQVVVVDQGGGDEVARMLDKLESNGVGTHRVVAKPIGRAAALNLGIAEVRTRFLAITDDDCIVAPDWLSQMHEALLAHHQTIVSGRIEDVGDEESVAHALSREYDLRTKPSIVYDVMSGGNAGMEKAVFDQVGPFDEDPLLRLAEDTEYAYRALRKGINLAYVPAFAVWHYAWRDSSQRDRQFRGYARSHGGYYGRYIRRGDLFIALKALFHLMRALKRWVRSVLKRDANMAAHARAYALCLVPGIIAGLKAAPGDTEL